MTLHTEVQLHASRGSKRGFGAAILRLASATKLLVATLTLRKSCHQQQVRFPARVQPPDLAVAHSISVHVVLIETNQLQVSP